MSCDNSWEEPVPAVVKGCGQGRALRVLYLSNRGSNKAGALVLEQQRVWIMYNSYDIIKSSTPTAYRWAGIQPTVVRWDWTDLTIVGRALGGMHKVEHAEHAWVQGWLKISGDLVLCASHKKTIPAFTGWPLHFYGIAANSSQVRQDAPTVIG